MTHTVPSSQKLLWRTAVALPQWTADEIEGMSFEQPGDGTPVITGRVANQSALDGVLQRIRDLGMPIVSVTRRPSTDDPNQKGNQS